MREPKPIQGAKALLFERLVDEDPHTPGEAQPFRIYGVAALRESVGRELMRLLNTRCPRLEGPVDEADRTILDYGVPSFSHISVSSETDTRQLVRILEQAITVYEPRLRNVQVTIEPSKTSKTTAVGSIEAMLVVGNVNEPVSFPLVLSPKRSEIILVDQKALSK
ncbi:MAG TPA: type VI secretion system baseplate subunit TssE [Candidatus Angelobacter sp.]|nr:type VI secretion system baseplate subunit TssE [Candidatus Angelobacter sp.]